MNGPDKRQQRGRRRGLDLGGIHEHFSDLPVGGETGQEAMAVVKRWLVVRRWEVLRRRAVEGLGGQAQQGQYRVLALVLVRVHAPALPLLALAPASPRLEERAGAVLRTPCSVMLVRLSTGVGRQRRPPCPLVLIGQGISAPQHFCLSMPPPRPPRCPTATRAGEQSITRPALSADGLHRGLISALATHHLLDGPIYGCHLPGFASLIAPARLVK